MLNKDDVLSRNSRTCTPAIWHHIARQLNKDTEYS